MNVPLTNKDCTTLWEKYHEAPFIVFSAIDKAAIVGTLIYHRDRRDWKESTIKHFNRLIALTEYKDITYGELTSILDAVRP